MFWLRVTETSEKLTRTSIVFIEFLVHVLTRIAACFSLSFGLNTVFMLALLPLLFGFTVLIVLLERMNFSLLDRSKSPAMEHHLRDNPAKLNPFHVREYRYENDWLMHCLLCLC